MRARSFCETKPIQAAYSNSLKSSRVAGPRPRRRPIPRRVAYRVRNPVCRPIFGVDTGQLKCPSAHSDHLRSHAKPACLSFFLGRIGIFAPDCFRGSHRFGRCSGFCRARGSSPRKADARLIAIGELDTNHIQGFSTGDGFHNFLRPALNRPQVSRRWSVRCAPALLLIFQRRQRDPIQRG